MTKLMNQHSYQILIIAAYHKYIPGEVSFHNWFYYYIRFVCLYRESRGPNKPLSEPNHRRELKTERARDSCCAVFKANSSGTSFGTILSLSLSLSLPVYIDYRIHNPDYLVVDLHFRYAFNNFCIEGFGFFDLGIMFLWQRFTFFSWVI